MKIGGDWDENAVYGVQFSDQNVKRFYDYRQLKKDAELIQAGHMDSRLEELCNEIMMWVISFFLLRL